MIYFEMESFLYNCLTLTDNMWNTYLTSLCIIFSRGLTGACTVTEVETRTETADVSEADLAQKTVMETQTLSVKGNGRLAGVTIHRAHAETTATATTTATSTATSTSTATTPRRTTETLTAGETDL